MANPNLINVTSVLGANAGFNLTNTATATLITVAADKLVKINRISVANVDGTNAATVDCFVDGMGSGSTGVTTTGADATVYLAKTITVPADTTLVLLDTPIYLMEGDVLKGGASANSDLDMFVSFEILDDSRTSSKDMPMYIARNVLKYPEQVKEFMENGYWWTNYELKDEIRSGLSFEFGDHELKYKKKYFSQLINELIKFYNAQDVIPIEFYGNCYSGNKDLYTTMAYLPHVDTYPGADEDINPLNDYAFNLNLTKSDKVKTAFYSFNNKRSICNFIKRDFDDLEIVRQKHESIEVKDWKKELADEDYENFKLEYISNIDYNIN